MTTADVLTDASFDPNMPASPEMCSLLSIRAEALFRAVHQKRDFDDVAPTETAKGVTFHFPLYEVDINPVDGETGQDFEVVARQFVLSPNSSDHEVHQHTYNLEKRTYQPAAWQESYDRMSGGGYGGYFRVDDVGILKGDEVALNGALAEGLQENVLDPLLACLRT